MASSIANINGTNITRLHVTQLGSNQTQCVLETALISDSDTSRYCVSLERLYLHTDIPIFPGNTKVFEIIVQGPAKQNGQIIDNPLDHAVCIVGPVYNFLDFCQQVQVFFDRYNSIEPLARIYVSGQMASKKLFAIRANEAFWTNRFIKFENTFGRLWETFGTEGCYHTRVAGRGFADDCDVIVMGDIAAGQDPELVYYEDTNVLPAFVVNPTWALTYGTEFVSITLRNRSDFFENRIAIRIDSVIPVPFETFAVGTSVTDTTARGSKRHSFVQVDFPQETISHVMTTHVNRVSDTFEIKQDLQSGAFELVSNAMNTLGKTMIPGQLQNHRYEIFLVRKTIGADRKVTFTQEALDFESGDFFMLSLLFTKQV
jgi:hypothetical protein